jgi:hypothetical protein
MIRQWLNGPSAIVAVAVAACCAIPAAAAPVVEYFQPAGGRQGTTVSVSAGGKFEQWPLSAWTDCPGLKIQAGAEKGALTFQIEKDSPPGPHFVRLYDPTGASTPFVFIVGRQSESAEAEPNDEVAKAQAVKELPVTVNGRLEKGGDVDCYAVSMEPGQFLVASVMARRLGAPTDPMLHLSDDAGNQLAFAHDGFGLDPLLVHRAEKAGRYVVRVSAFAHPPAAEVRLAGGPAAVYRLSLGTKVPVRYAFPAGVRRGTKGRVQLVEWGNAQDAQPTFREVDATGVSAREEFVSIPQGCGDECLRLALGEGPEMTESEIAGASATPHVLSTPAAVTGRVERDGEEDTYRFTARKGERLTITARAAAVASPMDALLRVEDEAGKLLAGDDDKGQGSDAQLEWAAPADGTYRVVVGDLFRKSGPGHVYRLSVRPAAAPGVAGTLDAAEYRVAPGKSVAVKCTVTRGPADAGGHPGGIVAVATGLSAGVTATAAEVPEKGGEVILTLTALADAKPAAGPVRIMLLATDPKRAAAWVATCSLKKDAGQELIPSTDAPWLTILPPPAEPPKK